MTHLRRVTTEVIGSPLVSKTSGFDEDPCDIAPLGFETRHEGREAELLGRYVWKRIMILLDRGKELDENSLLEEFDEPSSLWDDLGMERPTRSTSASSHAQAGRCLVDSPRYH